MKGLILLLNLLVINIYAQVATDKIAPIIHEVKLPKTIKVGKTVSLFFRATDDLSGIDLKSITACPIFVLSLTEDNLYFCQNIKNEGNDWYSITINTDKHIGLGKYLTQKYGQFGIIDRAGNESQMFNLSGFEIEIIK